MVFRKCQLRFKSNLTSRFVIAAGFLLLALFVFRKTLFMEGTIGCFYDWSIPPKAYQLLRMLGQALYLWQRQSLGMYQPSGPGFLINLGFALWGWFGLSGKLISKLLVIMIVAVAGYSMYLLVKKMLARFHQTEKDSINSLYIFPALLAGIFYSISPILFQQLVSGALLYTIAYSISPLIFLFFLKATEKNIIQFKYILISAVLYTIAAFQIQFLFFIFILIFFYSLFCEEKPLHLRALFVITILTLLFLSFWAIPTFINFTSLEQTGAALPSSSNLVSSLIRNSIQYTKIFNLVGWFDPLFITSIPSLLISIWYLISFLFVIIIFSTLIFYPRDKTVLFCIAMIIFSIFFMRGAYLPFGFVNIYLYKNYLPMQIFRSLHHFMFIPTFCYAILMGISIAYLNRRFNKKSLYFNPIFVVILVIYLYPSFTGDFGGKLQTFEMPHSYHKIDEFLSKSEEQDFRVVYLPMAGSSYRIAHQSESRWRGGGDPTVMYALKPTMFTDIIPEGYSKEFSILMEKRLYENKTENLARLFSLANVKYIIPRDNVRHAHVSYGNLYSFLRISNVLKRQKSIKLIENFYDTALFENDYFLPHIYPTTASTLVAGDIEALVPMTETKYLGGEWETGNGKGGKPVLLFTGQNNAHSSQLLAHIFHFPVTSFVFKDSGWRDLAIQTIAHSSWLIADSKKEKKEIKVEKAGRYEIYIDVSSIGSISSIGLDWLKIRVDGREIIKVNSSQFTVNRRKYIKVGEVEIEEGEHEIEWEMENRKWEMENRKWEMGDGNWGMEKQKIKLVLVNKKERERIDKELRKRIENSETEVCYIFSREKGEFYIP